MIRACEQRRRDRQAERSGGLRIERQREACGSFDGNHRRRRTREDLQPTTAPGLRLDDHRQSHGYRALVTAVDADASVVDIEDYLRATSEIAKTTLRSVLGKAELDTLLSERERLNEDLQRIIDEQTEPWGIKVTTVEIKDVEIPEAMQKAMARQAEAERERRAKIIAAEGEYQASEKLAQAAETIGQHPVAIQLRFMQTLTEIGSEANTTTIFPLPIDLFKPFLEATSKAAERRSGTDLPPPD